MVHFFALMLIPMVRLVSFSATWATRSKVAKTVTAQRLGGAESSPSVLKFGVDKWSMSTMERQNVQTRTNSALSVQTSVILGSSWLVLASGSGL